MPYSSRAADGAIRENLTIPQGSSWSRTWALSDPNGGSLTLDGWSARAQVRITAESQVVLYEWNSANPDLAGTTVLGNSSVTLLLTGAESANWTWRRGVWDLYVFNPDGKPTRLVEGTFTVSPSVTH